MRSQKILWQALLLLLVLLARSVSVLAQAPAATVDGNAITLEEVDRTIGASLAGLEEKIYQLRRQRLDALIAERLLAKEAARQGIGIDTLLEREVSAPPGMVTEKQVEELYEANKARLPALDANLRARLRAHLAEQFSQMRREALVARLRAAAQVEIGLQAPPVFRVTLNLAGAPVKGASTAPVTLVKFEDFHCPFCKEAQRTLAELLTRYGDRLRIVHKDYPIDSLHPLARRGHVAARCAHEQGKFWAYHDALYEGMPKAAPEDLTTFAKRSGLDLRRFDDCLASGKYAAAVDQDIDEGTVAGVSGTPAFFINGRFLSGAQPLEIFVRLIEEELAPRR